MIGFRRVATLVTVLASGILQAYSQVKPATPPSDPYRNFIGDWSGEVDVSPDPMPTTITLHVTEGDHGHRMRWDYVFGKPGEKGYSRDTKWLELKPNKSQMITQWKGQNEMKFKTFGLGEFADKGFGSFTALEEQKGPKAFKVTLALGESSLSYLWESSDGQIFKIYSRFHFVRDGVQKKTVDATEVDTKQR